MALRDERDFKKYIALLSTMADRYMIIFSVKDTPGNCITEDIAAEIMGLGFKESLHDKLQHGYIGIIDAGSLVYEDLSEGVEAIYLVMKYQGIALSVTSKSWKDGNQSEIKLDGYEYSVNRRGLNIVVYDTASRTLIDSVCFDAHVPAFTCSRYSDIIEARNSTSAAITAAGYSVAQYCLDNDMNNIVLYTKEKYWNFIEPVALSFRTNRNIVVKARFSEQPFRKLYQDSGYLGDFVATALDPDRLSRDDTVVVLEPFADTTFEAKIAPTGARVVQLPDLLQAARDYAIRIRPIYNFMSNHPKVSLILYSLPLFPKDHRSDWETELAQSNIQHWAMSQKIVHGYLPPWAEELEYAGDDLAGLATPPSSYLSPSGHRIYEDTESTYLHIHDNHRLTPDNPADATRTVYFVGGCNVFGVYAPDDATVPTYFQKMLNQSDTTSNIAVQNWGTYAWGRRDDVLSILESLPVQAGDVVLLEENLPIPQIDRIDCSQILQRPHDYGETFSDTGHFNENGYRAIAEHLFTGLITDHLLEQVNNTRTFPAVVPPPLFGISAVNAPNQSGELTDTYAAELREYKAMLSRTQSQIFGTVGSIVMNCNPFTLGHRYLIEQAAAQVNHLYIFAVEEDKSIFPFADRLELIKAGTADLPNVTVLPSGKFIISSLTFTDYFNKESLQDRAIDPSMDVRLFATEIAPTLNISVRFAGEEPLDKVTEQYNETMRRILPEYGIEFMEIPRKQFAGEVISASRVRKLLATKDFDAIATIVPKTTLDYLIQKFSA